MFKDLQMFQTSYAMARHAGARQAITAANMANADTPNYRAQSMDAFREAYTESSGTVRTSRAGHMDSIGSTPTGRVQFSDAEASPNGNTVSLEQEMVSSIEIQREHSRALAIYKHSLDIMRLSIGRR